MEWEEDKGEEGREPGWSEPPYCFELLSLLGFPRKAVRPPRWKHAGRFALVWYTHVLYV